MIFMLPDGMLGIDTRLTSKRKTYYRFLHKCIFFWIAMLLVLIYFNRFQYAVQAENSFIPATPFGPSSGYLDVTYDFTIFTTNLKAYWLFDWGDGTHSPWVQLTNGTSSIIQSHQWTTDGVYQVRVEFKNEFFKNGVWSDPLSLTINTAFSDDYPKSPVFAYATINGVTGRTYYYAAVVTDPQGETVQYHFDWGDGTISDWTSPIHSGGRAAMPKTWDKPGNYSVRGQVRDSSWLQSPWSHPLNITISLDSENETVSREILLINTVSHHIEYISGQEKNFINTTSGMSTHLQSGGEGTYVLDDNGDGKGDYVFTPRTGSLERYQPPPLTPAPSIQIPWFLIIIASIICCALITVFVLIKTGFLYVYEEVVAEK